MTPVELLFDASQVKDVQAQILGLIPVFDRVARASRNLFAQSAKDTVSVETAATKEIAKQADVAAKAKEKSAREAAKEQERVAREAQRAELSFIRAGQKAIESADKDRTRAAEKEAKERKRIAKEEAREAEALVASRSRAFGSAFGNAAGRTMGIAGRVAGIATAVGGGFAVADALRAGIDEERLAGVIYRGAAERGGIKSSKGVESLASAAAIQTGGTKEDILGGLDMFVRKTGNLGEAEKMLTRLAKAASASGADFRDMGNTAAEVFNQLGNSDETMSVMRALIGQGMTGAIDIKDLGQYGGRLAAGAAQFSGPLAGNIESFGALAQLAKKLGGATDTAEATESVARLGSDFAKNADLFRSKGVEVYSDKSHTKFRNAEDIISEFVVKTKGDIGILKEAFGERSVRAAIGAQVAYTNAGGGAAGEAAIRSQVAGFKSYTPTEDDLEAKNREAMAETGKRLNVALTQFHDAINTKLLPLMPELIDKFTRFIPSIQSAIEFFTSGSLWGGIAKAVSIVFAAELAKIGISAGIESIFTKIAKSVLQMTTPVANVNAGVVNVNGGAAASVAKNVIADVAKTGAGAATAATAAGGGAAVGLAGTLLGAGIIGAGAAIPLGFAFLGEKREASGADKLASIMAMPEGSDEEKRAKVGALEGAASKGRASQRFNELALRGEENDLGKYGGGNAERQAGLDRESDAYRKKLNEITAEIDSLKSSLQGAPAIISAFTDSLKSGSGERHDVPTGHWTNQAP